jgi:hypothetical protein
MRRMRMIRMIRGVIKLKECFCVRK